MYFKEFAGFPLDADINEVAGFSLDADKIKLHSSDKNNILLPYSGQLPGALQDNDGAAISVKFCVGLSVNICLVVTTGKTKLRYLVEATTQEINDIIFPFFFQPCADNSFSTNWDNGLSRYWLGYHQSSYIHWSRLIFEGFGINDLIGQLSPAAFKRVVKYVCHCDLLLQLE